MAVARPIVAVVVILLPTHDDGAGAASQICSMIIMPTDMLLEDLEEKNVSNLGAIDLNGI